MSTEPALGRLFVALPVPPRVGAALAPIRPHAAAGVRPVANGDLHLTLQFLGTAEIAPVVTALRSIRAAPFELRIAALGCFELRGGRRILWAGIERNAGLTELRASVGERLAALGFEAERRPYRPHLTLARLGPEAPAEVVRGFVGAELPAGLGFRCLDFALFASTTDPEGARYRVLETFRLEPAAG